MSELYKGRVMRTGKSKKQDSFFQCRFKTEVLLAVGMSPLDDVMPFVLFKQET